MPTPKTSPARRTLAPELHAARKAAEAAGALQLERMARVRHVRRKGDASPVTEVDRLCEEVIRDILLRAFPDDGFLGEETGETAGRSGRRWIADPLDGTRPFIRGIPTHSALVALEEDGEPVVGVIELPALGDSYWAAKGMGAFRNGQRIHVSKTTELSAAMGSALGFVEMAGKKRGRRVLDLLRRLDYAYGFMDAYTYGGVACGRLDLSVNLLDKAWDCAAAAVIVEEAGGAWSDYEGRRTVHNGSFVVANKLLHGKVLDLLNRSA